MSDQRAPAAGDTGDPALSDAEHRAARERLAAWLTADDPRYPVTADELAGWSIERRDEFVVLIPPGYANQIFLVAEQGITWYAPSRDRYEDAAEAARAPR